VRGYPLVGGIIDFLRDGPGFLTRVARERPGEIVGLRLGPVTAYLVTHPDHVQHVLQDQLRSFCKGPLYKAATPLLGNGLVSSEGPFWLRPIGAVRSTQPAPGWPTRGPLSQPRGARRSAGRYRGGNAPRSALGARESASHAR